MTKVLSATQMKICAKAPLWTQVATTTNMNLQLVATWSCGYTARCHYFALWIMWKFNEIRDFTSFLHFVLILSKQSSIPSLNELKSTKYLLFNAFFFTNFHNLSIKFKLGEYDGRNNNFTSFSRAYSITTLHLPHLHCRVGTWAPMPFWAGFLSPLPEPYVPLSRYTAPHKYVTYLLSFNHEFVIGWTLLIRFKIFWCWIKWGFPLFHLLRNA